MNSDNFTVLVSGAVDAVSEQVYWVSFAFKMTESASDFALSLDIPPWKLF